ncbi:MAG: DUF502 domain-containing protein [Proteobacteria bacterium]|nr:DUF502 domain-containing protein [Pseudomonadota bacterium]
MTTPLRRFGRRLQRMLVSAARAVTEATRRYFVAGLLVFAPVGITIWAIAWIIRTLDNMLLPWVLSVVYPELESPPQLPLLGAIFTFAVIILIGVIARHFFGYELLRAWERMLSRVPVARSIYGGVKQLFEAIVHPNMRSSFNRVVLVEYPRKGCYAIAFTTGLARGPVQRARPETLVNCFLPTTPNPTSGFYLLIPEDEVYDIDLSVEEAFKVIMSAGLVTPGDVAPMPQPSQVAAKSGASSARG